MKSFLVPEMTFKRHSRSSKTSSPGLSNFYQRPVSRKVGYRPVLYFLTKSAEMSLKIDQGHWQWPLSVVIMCLSCIFR